MKKIILGFGFNGPTFWAVFFVSRPFFFMRSAEQLNLFKSTFLHSYTDSIRDHKPSNQEIKLINQKPICYSNPAHAECSTIYVPITCQAQLMHST